MKTLVSILALAFALISCSDSNTKVEDKAQTPEVSNSQEVIAAPAPSEVVKPAEVAPVIQATPESHEADEVAAPAQEAEHDTESTNH